MTASDLGDVLAGFFAPAAFFVLIIAVFLQSLELKAQRQELTETRDVFLAQNRLLKAQTASAIKSTQLLENQNDILIAQEQFRIAEVSKTELEDLLKRLEVIIRTRLNNRIPMVVPGGDKQMGGLLRPLFQTRNLELPPETRAAIGTAVTSAIFAREAFGRDRAVAVYNKYGHREAFLAAAYLCDLALQKSSAIGQAKSNLSLELRLGEFGELLRDYLNNPVPESARTIDRNDI